MKKQQKELLYPCNDCNHKNKEYCGQRFLCKPWVGWVKQEWRKIQETFKRNGTNRNDGEKSNG